MADPAVVLIAEDDRSIAHVVAAIVEDAGGKPVVAHDGRQALELARSSPPALVITDLMMPILDGVRLVQALRQEAAARGEAMPPVILMTAAGPRYAEEVGADAMLRKPFDLAELETLLHRFLG
jgi:two-component system chemotaxis response regulator CheY